MKGCTINRTAIIWKEIIPSKMNDKNECILSKYLLVFYSNYLFFFICLFCYSYINILRPHLKPLKCLHENVDTWVTAYNGVTKIETVAFFNFNGPVYHAAIFFFFLKDITLFKHCLPFIILNLTIGDYVKIIIWYHIFQNIQISRKVGWYIKLNFLMILSPH